MALGGVGWGSDSRLAKRQRDHEIARGGETRTANRRFVDIFSLTTLCLFESVSQFVAETKDLVKETTRPGDVS